MKTKNDPYGLKCKINPKNFSTKGFPKGGGSAIWEKFPKNTVSFGGQSENQGKRRVGDDSLVVRVKIKIKKEGKRRVGDDSLVGDNPGTFNPLPPIILDRPTHRREN